MAQETIDRIFLILNIPLTDFFPKYFQVFIRNIDRVLLNCHLLGLTK